MNNSAVQQLLKIFNKFTIQQKFIIGAVLLASVLIFGIIFIFLNEPNYSTLYSNLNEQDASKVIDYLNSQKISYELVDNGRTITVPKNKLYEVRLSLAAKGIPNSGISGYEIFDKNTMGMSEFMQKLNFKRALEGELARTIMQQEEVEGARVLIVLPEKTIFKAEEKQPKASVVVKLVKGTSLSSGNITAITNLVANSVEGLTPENVTLIDTRGRLLSKKTDDEQSPINTKQYEIKQSVEKYLTNKAQSILNQVIGFGNSTVQVNADFNFDQVEKTMETYDPESQVAISEQTTKNENAGKTVSDTTVESSQSNTINYEINKTVQKVISGTGNINRLSIAVVVNDIEKEVKKGDKTETVYEPRSPEQMKKLENIIKNAVGLDLDRGDQISIVNIPFATKEIKGLEISEPTSSDGMDKIIDLVLILVAIGASFFLLKGIMNKLKDEKLFLTGEKPEGALPPSLSRTQRVDDTFSSSFPDDLGVKRRKTFISAGDLEDEITDEAMIKKRQQEKISSYVSKNPDDAARLINSWLHADELQQQ